jgi:hypothetical protein
MIDEKGRGDDGDSNLGLPDGWRERCINCGQSNGSIRELWLFGSRGPKGGARLGSDVDIGIALKPAVADHDWAFGNYVALGKIWQGELEKIVGAHVSLVPMVPGNEGDTVIRSTGVCLWKV